MKVRSLPAAKADARAAGDYLNNQQRGLGRQFAAEFRLAFGAIRANPQSYPRTEDGPDEPENREFTIARFHYRVIYAVWKGEAVIVAVLHARRQPGTWRDRLADLTTEE